MYTIKYKPVGWNLWCYTPVLSSIDSAKQVLQTYLDAGHVDATIVREEEALDDLKHRPK